ncbi:MAG: DUF2397 domain-containing protein [Chloroflexi bacterium]|nr:DUF2397 domain-containing protein [Chloroflexota bacterium]MCL5108795.1 DUF2397 domain-containing protein [Chloroflexota bacterium]
MAKKSSGRRTKKTPPRHLHHVEPWPSTAPADEPVTSPAEAPVPEAAVRQTVSLRRPGSQSGYAVRRDRPSASSVVAMPTDYSYVLRDLRRVGVLLAIIVVVLLALTFVLR